MVESDSRLVINMVKLNGKELTDEEEMDLKKRILSKIRAILHEEMGIEVRTVKSKSGETPLMTIGFLAREDENKDDDEDYGFGGLGWFPGTLIKDFFLEYSKELILFYANEGDEDKLKRVMENMGAQVKITEADEKYDPMFG